MSDAISKNINAELPVNPNPRKEYTAKGSNSLRCECCMLSKPLCICHKRSPYKLTGENPVHICF